MSWHVLGTSYKTMGDAGNVIVAALPSAITD